MSESMKSLTKKIEDRYFEEFNRVNALTAIISVILSVKPKTDDEWKKIEGSLEEIYKKNGLVF